jgi:hypothetical protein
MATKSTFEEKLNDLERRIGHGTISAVFAVNQPYAAYQHVHRDLRHPRGGGPDYVSMPLAARHGEWIRSYAGSVLRGSQVEALAGAMDDLNDYVRVLAPLDLDNLRQSGGFQIFEGGQLVYSRPAAVPRLTK